MKDRWRHHLSVSFPQQSG